jgi:hypothetical protein
VPAPVQDCMRSHAHKQPSYRAMRGGQDGIFWMQFRRLPLAPGAKTSMTRANRHDRTATGLSRRRGHCYKRRHFALLVRNCATLGITAKVRLREAGLAARDSAWQRPWRHDEQPVHEGDGYRPGVSVASPLRLVSSHEHPQSAFQDLNSLQNAVLSENPSPTLERPHGNRS